MKLKINRTTALIPRGYLVQWTVDGAVESGEYKFEITFSGGPEGPWTVLAVDLVNTYAFKHVFEASTYEVLQPNQLNFFRSFYYQVTVTTPSGKKVSDIAENEPIAGDTIMDLKMRQYERKSKYDFGKTLNHNGTPCAFLKRRRWGVVCKLCSDPRNKTVMRSNCRTCWGTGIVGGYWAPFYTHARHNVSTNVSTIGPTETRDSNDIKLWMPDFPNVELGDVVVFFREQIRYRLDQSAQTQIRLQAIHQVVSAQEIPHGDIIYQFNVRADQVNPLF